MTNRIILDGLLKAEIQDFHTSLVIDKDHFAQVYGSAQLPEIFREGRVASAVATHHIEASLFNNGQVLALLALLVIVVVGGLILLVAMRFQTRQFTVLVDGIESARLSLPRLSRREIEVGGIVRAYLWRGWGSGYKIVPRQGVRIRRDGPAWLLKIGDEIGQEHRIEIQRGWAVKRRSPFGGQMGNG